MARGDFTLFTEGSFGSIGSRKYKVASGTTLAIRAGEPVAWALGGYVVTAMATNKPVCGTDFLAGIAASDSTETAAAVGYVEVTPLVEGQVWLGNPNVAATWDTQAEYDLLVGDRVLIDLTGTAAAGTANYTVLAADNATYGCVIQPLDVVKHPGKVAFSFKTPVSSLYPSS
jgi:hypothetical protein